MVRKKDVRDVQAGKDVEVGSVKEADALLHAALPNARKCKGTGPGNGPPDFSKFKTKPGDKTPMYHKDYQMDPATGRIYGHAEGNPHGDYKHINIKLGDGSKSAIMIRPK